MIDVERVLSFVQRDGPLLPTKVAKEFRLSLLIASAVLSQLVSEKKVLVSKVKIGTSPLYYVAEQRESLQRYSNNLHEKDQRAYRLIQKKKIIRDVDQEPLIRVALRAIGDFARPLTVKSDHGEQLFWKWYLLSEDEAKQLITDILNPPAKKRDPVPGGESGQKTLTEKKEQAKEAQPEPKTEPKVQSKVESRAEPKAEPKVEPTEESREKKESSVDESSPKEERVPENPVAAKLSSTKSSPASDAWTETVCGYLDLKGAVYHDLSIIKKNQEAELFVQVPSSLGTCLYYCRARKKKRISESDIVQALYTAQDHKLPLLFLTNGTLTKKMEQQRESKHQGMLFVTLP